MEQSYYKAYYRLERENWWFKVRAKILLHRAHWLFGDTPNARILNVGVATGYTSELLARLGTVESVEYDEQCFRFLKEHVPIEVVQGSILALPFEDNYFDAVCAFDVIEHVLEDRRAAQELMRVTKPGGGVMVTVPAFRFLWGQHDVINHHVRRYTLKELRSLFVSSGEVNYATYFNTLLFLPIALFRVISRLLPAKDRNQSDFAVADGKLVNRLFYAIFYAEYRLIKQGIRFPVGVSLALTWRKTQRPSDE